jgi:hypothetical protein
VAHSASPNSALWPIASELGTSFFSLQTCVSCSPVELSRAGAFALFWDLKFRHFVFALPGFLGFSRFYFFALLFSRPLVRLLAKTGQPKPDSQQKWVTRTGQAEQDRQNRTGRKSRTARIRWPEQDNQNREAEQDRKNRTILTGLPTQDCQDRTSWAGQSEQGSRDRTARKRTAMTASIGLQCRLPVQDCQDVTKVSFYCDIGVILASNLGLILFITLPLLL